MEPATYRVRLLGAAEGPAIAGPILRSVPDWFGIESSTVAYIQAAGRLPTYVASTAESDVGFLTVERHHPQAAEVHCMAVDRGWHGRGAGTALMRHMERTLADDGVLYLQVKTQGPSKPSSEYARTLTFYLRCGFTPLEEVRGLWPGIPCLILVKKLEPLL